MTIETFIFIIIANIFIGALFLTGGLTLGPMPWWYGLHGKEWEREKEAYANGKKQKKNYLEESLMIFGVFLLVEIFIMVIFLWKT